MAIKLNTDDDDDDDDIYIYIKEKKEEIRHAIAMLCVHEIKVLVEIGCTSV